MSATFEKKFHFEIKKILRTQNYLKSIDEFAVVSRCGEMKN